MTKAEPGVEETVSWLCRPDPDSPTGQPDEYISVHVNRGMPSSVSIPAADISTVVDERLRAALDRQLAARRQKLGYAIVVIAYWPSGDFSHSLRVPTRSLVEYASQAER